MHRRATILAVAVLPLAALARAQSPGTQPAQADSDTLITLMRKDVRAEKADIISKTMALDAKQAAVFGPLYRQHEAEIAGLGDEKLAVIQDLAESFETLDDAKAKDLLERSFVIEEKRIAIQRKYKEQMLKVLPAKIVARFFQVESRLNNMVNLELSSSIPLVY